MEKMEKAITSFILMILAIHGLLLVVCVLVEAMKPSLKSCQTATSCSAAAQMEVAYSTFTAKNNKNGWGSQVFTILKMKSQVPAARADAMANFYSTKDL